MLTEQVLTLFGTIFGDDVPRQPLPLGQVAARTLLVYSMGLAMIRLGKSRLISGVTSVDVISGFILGSVLSRGITGDAALSGTFVASAVMIATHWIFTRAAWHWPSVGSLVKGTSYLLVEDGRVLDDQMCQSHITRNDLHEAMRRNGIESLQDVKRAYKERNGEVTIIKAKPE